jgi:site-specific recombinase XerD
LLFRQLQSFGHQHGLVFLSDFDVDWARKFRATWPNKNVAARKKLEHFRAFFRFCHDSNWIDFNPAAKIKPPKVIEQPTLPFNREEIARILPVL